MLSKNTVCAGLLAALLALGAGPSAALSTIEITGFQSGLTTIKGVYVYTGTGWLNNLTVAAGAFTWNLDQVAKDTPLYCVDVFHSYYWGQTWQANCIPSLPGPTNPLSHNTAEAAWIYQKYGVSASRDTAAGVQLALWEITHDKNWRQQSVDALGAVQWWAAAEGSDFNYRGSKSVAAFIRANAILQDLYQNYRQAEGGVCSYYQPPTGTDYYAAGHIGDGAPTVPEPGTLALLGIGLCTVAGSAWRRAKR